MNLAVRLLNNVCNVNDFEQVSSITLTRGNPDKIYFRVVQPSNGDLRYIPTTPTTGLVKFLHNDNSKKISRAASQPFAGDTSIWSVDVLSTDEIQFDSMTFQLTEGTGPGQTVKTMNVLGDIVTEDVDTRKKFC